MIGKHIDHYEILELVGRGGMGEVYRARDPRLDREVAIKILPDDRLGGTEARTRFEREARAVAALSHPNILAIHDVGEHEGVAYAVTELLEGRTLSEELADGPMPLRNALDVAGQVADGLAAAHDKGIVHRDIKPANVFLTTDGRAKILDFGLAKAGGPTADHGGADDRTLAATVAESTSPGTVLGTVRYMSPEQVRARPVDHRADIFSFGAVLWEMLVGRPTFDGDSAVETMNAILKQDPPDPSLLVGTFPTSVERILRRCLEKEPERRFQSARDLAFALRGAGDSSGQTTSGVDLVAPSRRSRNGTVLAGLALLLLGAVAGTLLGRTTTTPIERVPLKIEDISHSGLDFAPTASPDGRTIAFVSQRDGRERIWLRQLDGGFEAPLTEGNDIAPAFSPDGTSLLFLRDEGTGYSAYRVATVGGAPRKVLDTVIEACWSPDGERLGFLRGAGTMAAPEAVVGIHDIRTGTTRDLTTFHNQFTYGLEWSPDGRWLSMSATAAVLNAPTNSLVLVDTEDGTVRTVLDSPTRLSSAAWTPDGELLVLGRSTSQLGDTSGAMGLVLSLDPFAQEERPLFWIDSVWAGAVDYTTFDFVDESSIVFDEILWRGNLTEIRRSVDGDFDVVGPSFTQGRSRDRQPAYAPDGRRLVFSSNRSGNLDLWILETDTGLVRQLTDDRAQDWDPAFGADGRSLFWSSNRGGHLEIWTAQADGSGARRLTRDGINAENPTQSPDGRWVYYGSGNPAHQGIWRIRSDGSEAEVVAPGTYLLPEVSPDGRYVAYVAIDPENLVAEVIVSDVETREVVFRTAIPIKGFQRLITSGRPRWMPDGSALVFVGPDEDDRSVLFVQDFRPGEDTSSSLRVLLRMESGEHVESFGITPDGSAITVSHMDHVRTLRMAQDVFGTDR